MPPYPGNSLAELQYENTQFFFYQNETAPTGTLSAAFELRRERGNFYPNGLSVQVAFAADPGVFEVDVMTSDTDVAAYFVQTAQITTVNAGFVGRVELPNIYAKYVAVAVKTLTNAVAVTVMGTR